MHLAADHNYTPKALQALKEMLPMQPRLDSPLTAARAILTRAVVQFEDVEDAETAREYAPHVARAAGFRSGLAAPMLREGNAVGAIFVAREQPGLFSADRIELLKTFADQAVIAIENVRLFTELQEKNRALTEAHAQVSEALDQQTATAEILRVISQSPTDVQPVFDAIAESAARLCDGIFGIVYRLDGNMVQMVAHHNASPEGWAAYLALYPRPLNRQTNSGRAMLDGRVAITEDIEADTERSAATRDAARLMGLRSAVTVPLLHKERTIGALTVGRDEPGTFSPKQVALLQTFADQAVIAIENVRLFNETKEALDQQTATSEILRAISSSPTDVGPVFDAIAERAAQLCEADDAEIYRVDGDVYRRVAHRGPVPIAGPVGEAYPISRGRPSSRAIVDRKTIHIQDQAAEIDREFPDLKTWHQVAGVRTILATPLLREDVALGVIVIRRTEVKPFSDKHIALLQTFADQAVIAIENVRLFNETKEALEQQTATAEILRVISSSPTDIQPVLDAVAESAARLTATFDVAVFLRDGDSLRLAAHHGPLPARSTVPLIREEVTGRAVLDGGTVHVADLQSETVEYPGGSENARRLALRTILSVPLLREGGIALGTINLRRSEARLFTEQQIALLKTFADQAVIAIENVRLFKELQEKNRALTEAHAQVSEALDRQTATSEILRVISSSPTDVQPVFEAIVASAIRLCAARMGAVHRYDGELVHLAVLHNFPPQVVEVLRSMYPRPPQPDQASGRAILTRAVAQIEDMPADSQYTREVTEAGRWRSILAVPMLRDGVPIGAIVITRSEAGRFGDTHIELLKAFADQAVIAIENVRLFTELQTSNRDLTTALDKQTATSDILRVISRSQTDIRPVFDTIIASAVRLLGGHTCGLTRVTGDQLELVALTSIDAAAGAPVRAAFPQSLQAVGAHPQAIRDRVPLNVADAHTDARLAEGERVFAGIRGFRSWVVVPMLRDDVTIGSIGVTRRDAGGFTADEIALLQTFADQAVIAIENVRLFTELQEKNRALTEALDQQTATSEILRVIASSPTDVQPVFDTIVRSAVLLCGAMYGSAVRFDGELMHLAAGYNYTPESLRPFTRRSRCDLVRS